jgi:hypothetical protein
MNELNAEMKLEGRRIWLFLDNSATHSLPESARGTVWEANTLRLRGFRMSNVNVVFLPPNVNVVFLPPMDAGIIAAFKAHYRRRHLLWHISRLDAGFTGYADKCKPDLKDTILWVKDAWNSLSLATICNCWNKVELLK